MAQVYSVKQINSYIKNMMRQDFLLNRIQVKGKYLTANIRTRMAAYFSHLRMKIQLYQLLCMVLMRISLTSD